MLHLILAVNAFGYMLCAELIRCHRTELISAATLACTGRPWLGLSVRSFIRLTKEGRLCARDYPSPVNGNSLERWFGYWDPVPVWDRFVCHDGGRLPQWWRVSGGHGATQDGMSVIR